MQAFIPAAGLGTRLYPLTEHRPKALVEVDGVPLLKIAIDRLSRMGIGRIVVNVHHFADKVCDYLSSHRWDAEVLVSDESNMLLDTGGGLKKASSLFNAADPILLHNVDVLSNINLMAMAVAHSSNNDLVTLAVSDRQTSRYLLFDKENQLKGWENRKSGETLWVNTPISSVRPLAFSGIAILDPQALQLLPPCDKPYSIIPCYLNMAKSHRISCFLHPQAEWMDVGTPQRLSQAQSWYHSLQR